VENARYKLRLGASRGSRGRLKSLNLDVLRGIQSYKDCTTERVFFRGRTGGVNGGRTAVYGLVRALIFASCLQFTRGAEDAEIFSANPAYLRRAALPARTLVGPL
jgi:hypothetical protein